MMWLVSTSELVVVGPMGLHGDKQTVVAAEEDLFDREHKRVA
jgi:hypothetical protein